jgi:hypothetical protein
MQDRPTTIFFANPLRPILSPAFTLGCQFGKLPKSRRPLSVRTYFYWNYLAAAVLHVQRFRHARL